MSLEALRVAAYVQSHITGLRIQTYRQLSRLRFVFFKRFSTVEGDGQWKEVGVEERTPQDLAQVVAQLRDSGWEARICHPAVMERCDENGVVEGIVPSPGCVDLYTPDPEQSNPRERKRVALESLLQKRLGTRFLPRVSDGAMREFGYSPCGDPEPLLPPGQLPPHVLEKWNRSCSDLALGCVAATLDSNLRAIQIWVRPDREDEERAYVPLRPYDVNDDER